VSEDERQISYLNREISKLSYFARLLQEARDPRVPLYERIRFLAIFSALLDEFFRVRFAALRSLLRDRARTTAESGLDPSALVHRIHEIVTRQQEELGRIRRVEITRELNERGIFVHEREDELGEAQMRFVQSWYADNLAALLKPELVGAKPLDLKNGVSYLAVQLGSSGTDSQLAVVEVPAQRLSRFVSLPGRDGRTEILYLDDVIRYCLADIFPDYEPVAAHAVKLTRDAELHLDDEFSGDLLEQIKDSLRRRDAGVPSRFLYDMSMPPETLRRLQQALRLSEEDLFPGWRYHNMSDLADLPLPERSGCLSPSLVPIPHPHFTGSESIFEQIDRGDAMLYFPYQSYEPVLRFVRESAADPDVESIMISLYRVATDSEIVRSLVEAAQAGKMVTVFVEVGARFDEESNIYWAEKLEKAGASVLYNCPGLKVHSKLCLVARRERRELSYYTYVSTGNFNEKTARSYCDLGVFTTDASIAGDTRRVFEFLLRPDADPELETLVVAPFTLRSRFIELVDTEIQNARAGKRASILLKINNLAGPRLISKLYEASEAGVEIRLIVRSICCLIPGVPGLSENIEVISLVDRFLEHARIYIFHNGGDERFYVASADLMTRNLRKRIEVVLPITDPGMREDLRRIVELQWGDAVKARVIDGEQSNRYRERSSDRQSSQEEIYELFRSMRAPTV
jgi:polyphosphate kinase